MSAPNETSTMPFGPLAANTMTKLVPMAAGPMAATGAAAMGAAGAGWAMWLGWTSVWLNSGQSMLALTSFEGTDASTPAKTKATSPAKRAPKAAAKPTSVSTVAVAEPAPAPKADPKPDPVAAPVSVPEPVVGASAKAITTRPMALDAPKHGKSDDLKLISGVGPKLEIVLNDLGIYHFDQVASWTKTEIDWVDDYLKFSGRIERDGWVAQAKALASGGVEEYIRVFGKEPR